MSTLRGHDAFETLSAHTAPVNVSFRVRSFGLLRLPLADLRAVWQQGRVRPLAGSSAGSHEPAS